MSVQSIRAARNRAVGARVAARIIGVIGRPCAGKTTFVEASRSPGDVVVDLDALAVAFGSGDPYDHDTQYLVAARAARDSALRALAVVDVTVWLIATMRSQVQSVGLPVERIEVIDTPVDVCVKRALAQGRTSAVLEVIRSWKP